MAGYNFKNEEEVQEYLKNLYTEYKFGCYGEKKPEVCHLLGDYYEAIKKQFKEAADIYKNNCDNLDHGRSCAKYGGWRLIGKGCKKDVVDGYKYIKKGCDLGDEIGCTNAGILSVTCADVQGENRKAVIDNGVKMLDKACVEKKSDKACFFVAGMFMSGIEGILEKNPKRVYKYSLQACEYGNPYACMNVSRMHKNGDGVEKNDQLAENFLKRAEELDKQIKEYQRQLEFGQGIKT